MRKHQLDYYKIQEKQHVAAFFARARVCVCVLCVCVSVCLCHEHSMTHEPCCSYFRKYSSFCGK